MPVPHGPGGITIGHQIRTDAADVGLLVVCTTPLQVVVGQVVPLVLQIRTRQIWEEQLDNTANPGATKAQMEHMPDV